MKLSDSNPYIRTAQIQPAVLEAGHFVMAYDHRLFYILEGSGTLVLQDRAVPIQENDMILFRPAVGYHFRGKMRVVVLNFDFSRAATHLTKPICPPPIASFDPQMIFNNDSIDELEQPIIFQHAQIFKSDLLAITRSFSKTDPLADATCSALLKKLIASLLYTIQQPLNATELLVEQIKHYIQFYAAEISGNEEIATKFGYHPVYLSQIFREHTGKNLHRAILDARIELACQFLSRTDYCIEEIAYQTGFSSRSHFCSVFHKIMGITAREYRAQLQSSRS